MAHASTSFTCSLNEEDKSSLERIAQTYIDLQKTREIVSSYGHENHESHTSGRRHLRQNCYGFVNHILHVHFPKAFDFLVDFMKSDHSPVPESIDGLPCPFNFRAAFEHSRDHDYIDSPFEHVDHDDVRPGDLIVYEPTRHEPKATTTFSSRPTGMHIMIVKSVGRTHKNTTYFEIIDCTRTSHDKFYDSRRKLPKRLRGGIGKARLYLKKNKSGRFDRLRWRPGGKVVQKAIVVGRIKPLHRRNRLTKPRD